MPSIRKQLTVNTNNSKNTRMNFGFGDYNLNLRPDELAHLSRYDLAIRNWIETSQRIGKPINILNIGCGEMLDLSLFYSAYVIKKTDVINSYLGIDIDPNLNQIKDRAYFKGSNAALYIRDLTVNPKLKFIPNNFIDFAQSFEVVEHMGREFVEPWIKSVKRVLKPGAKFLLSTPNHDCSNKKLPKDHVYEWGFDELREMLKRHFQIETVVGGFMQLRFWDKLMQTDKIASERTKIEQRFGLHWARVILAYKYPKHSQNCIWHLVKK